MKLNALLLAPSAKLKDAQLRTRAEMLSGALIVRQFLLLGIMTIVYFNPSDSAAPLVAASMLNLACYFVSRTTLFKGAAFVAIADPLIFMFSAALLDIGVLSRLPQATIALLIGPLLSSLVLSKRTTVGVIALTVLVYGVILSRIEMVYWRAFAEQAVMIICISLVSLVGLHLRDKSEDALKREHAKFLQASKLSSLGEMASGIAHELNSPLAAIMLNIELLESAYVETEPSKAEVQERLSEVSKTAERMSKIIKAMKTIARDSAGDDLVKVPLTNWIDDTLSLCQQRFHAHGVELRVDRENMDQVCAVRPVQMTQALLNLMNNSFDAVMSENNSRSEKWVSMTAVLQNNCVELRVSDSGPGVESAFVERLFEPFATTKDFGQGTGLGLSVSRSIVQSHRGELNYDERAENTTFVIRIPQGKAA